MTTQQSPRSRAELARERAGRRKRRLPLGVDAIVDVALRLVDTEGVEAVSMRRVAAEFDTGPASLYAHVSNKDELLRLVLDRALAAMPMPTGETWQELVRSWALITHDEFCKHNDLASVTFADVPVGDHLANVAELLLGKMIEGGVPAKVAGWAMDIMALYVAADAYEGWLMGRRFDDGSGRPPEVVGADYFGKVGAFFAGLSKERYPYLTSNIKAMFEGDGEERFRFGIDMLIAGFAAQIPGGVRS